MLEIIKKKQEIMLVKVIAIKEIGTETIVEGKVLD